MGIPPHDAGTVLPRAVDPSEVQGQRQRQPGHLRRQGGPGPDYKVFLVRGFADSKADFLKLKDKAHRISEAQTFNRCLMDVSANVDVGPFTMSSPVIVPAASAAGRETQGLRAGHAVAGQRPAPPDPHTLRGWVE